MPEGPVTLDEFTITLMVPRDLPDAAVTKARRVLNRKSFRGRLGQAVEGVLRQYPALAPLTVALSR